ncbi:MAG TPA: vanadium-dependent haloperoxidase [Thermoanaerobaculia bacterium]|nr:vanadium-dependent haloperoxidase [Thermoanaerobaculia bacterium]
MPSKAHTLVDNFNDNSLDTGKWWVFGGPTPAAERVRETNGLVEIRMRSTDPGYGASGYHSVSAYDLTNSYFHAELIHPFRSHVATRTFLQVASTAGVAYLEVGGGGRLLCGFMVSGVYTTVAEQPYDPQAHRWLRLREQFGALYWETAPDALTWTAVASRPDPFNLTDVALQIGAVFYDTLPSPGVVLFDNVNVVETSQSRRVEERRLSARDVRVEAAQLAASRHHPEPINNNDEVNYPTRPFAGNYSKSLKHDSLGDPDPASYATLLRALQSQDPVDFEEIQLATPPVGLSIIKLTNPQSGLAFDVAGPDAQELTMPPAPRFESEQTAHEMGELYWMALARDIAFSEWDTQAATAGSIIQRAIASLNDEFPAYGGSRPVTAGNLFRGIYPGELVGPYLSQFLIRGNVDPRKPAGQGRDAADGFISYGSRTIDQRITPAVAFLNYLTSFPSWLNAQNGVDARGQDQLESTRRFIRNLRDGATFVHFDQVLDAFYNAAWILMSEPSGNQLTFQSGVTGRPQIDLEFPKDQGNFYDPPGTAMDSRTQTGFATFGPIHLLQVLGEALGRALRAVWWQKWGVHRRLRPEEYGGRVNNHLTGTRTYPLHSSLLTSLQSGLLSNYYGGDFTTFTTYLLPQAYPEGAPTHPAYGAGHATGSGACATILKAFFDDTKAIENPLRPSSNGLTLQAYTGTDASQMTVGSEINKLAGNIAIFRNAAGVHWRSDYTDSLPFGEAIAIRMLQEMSLTFNEDDAFFGLTKFDGQRVRIFDGKVVNAE